MNRPGKMSPRRQSTSTMGIGGNGRIGQCGNDRVSSSLSPSSFSKTGRREQQQQQQQQLPRSEKPRSVPTKSTRRVPVIARARPRSGAVTSGVPEDVAVHFGNFYGRDSPSTKGEIRRYNAGTTRSEYPASEAPRSEFTRQMVHELERLAGTENYARQVSALLDTTVESPNFYVKPPPADNFVPYQRSEPSDYPLWYKEPDKMLSSADAGRSVGRGNQTRKPSDVNTVMNSARATVASEIRRCADATDCENNDESSCATTSDTASDSDANTEEDTDCDEVKAAIVVK